jgi:hypothetical protein
MTTEQQLRERLRKITALFERAATPGEQQAAAAAIDRIRQALNASVKAEIVPETKFSMADQWQRRLFYALCRRYGLEPYRYKGQRHTTVMVRAPRPFVNTEATNRIIREEVFGDTGEAAERAASNRR